MKTNDVIWENVEIIDKTIKRGFLSTKYKLVIRFLESGIIKEIPTTIQQYYDFEVNDKFSLKLYYNEDVDAFYTYKQ